jgi:hypothetical protein
MNIDLKLTVPFVASTQYSNIVLKTSVLLEPFYTTEEDVLNQLLEVDTNNKIKNLRKIIFDKSVIVLGQTSKLESFNLLDKFAMFNLRRQYTTCLVVYEVTKLLKADSYSSNARSKKLGDFEVKTDTTANTDILKRILDDTQECISHYEQLIKDFESERVVPRSFVKGDSNPLNTNSAGRMWWLSDMSPYSDKAFANTKYFVGANKYKDGR